MKRKLHAAWIRFNLWSMHRSGELEKVKNDQGETVYKLTDRGREMVHVREARVAASREHWLRRAFDERVNWLGLIGATVSGLLVVLIFALVFGRPPLGVRFLLAFGGAFAFARAWSGSRKA